VGGKAETIRLLKDKAQQQRRRRGDLIANGSEGIGGTGNGKGTYATGNGTYGNGGDYGNDDPHLQQLQSLLDMGFEEGEAVLALHVCGDSLEGAKRMLREARR